MDGASLNQLLARFPRVVLAVLGISGVDVETPGGYYAVLAFYAVICASLYGASLGAGAVNREAVDKTYEFLFTRPRSRAAILSMPQLLLKGRHDNIKVLELVPPASSTIGLAIPDASRDSPATKRFAEYILTWLRESA